MAFGVLGAIREVTVPQCLGCDKTIAKACPFDPVLTDTVFLVEYQQQPSLLSRILIDIRPLGLDLRPLQPSLLPVLLGALQSLGT